MKKWKMILTAAMPLAMALSFPAFAGEWHEDMNGWWYENDDGSYCRNGWYWIDGMCYYFNPVSDGTRGAMKRNCEIDGYQLNADGIWVVNGVVQTK